MTKFKKIINIFKWKKKCNLHVVDLSNKQCLMSLVSGAMIEEIAFQRDVCGIVMSYRPVKLGVALRRLEADALTAEIQASRSSSTRFIAEKERVEKIIQELINRGSAVKVWLYLLVCGSREAAEAVSDKLSIYGCKASTRCMEELHWLANTKFFRINYGYFASQSRLSLIFEDIIKYISLINAAGKARIAVPIGVENRLGVSVYLPLLSDNNVYHTVIVGPTGKGKTTLLALIGHIALRTGKVSEVYIIDPKGDLKALLEGVKDVYIIDIDKLHRIKKSSVDGVRMLLIDESWRIDPALLSAFYRLARSRRVAVIAATQDPWDLNNTVWSNASNIIAFGSHNENYLIKLGKLGGIAEEGLKQLRLMTQQGEFGIRYPWSNRIVLARIPRPIAAKL